MIGALVAGITGSGGASLSSYESIATATGTGSSGTITFSSIPSTFKHLQIRFLNIVSSACSIGFTVNGVGGTSYAWHYLGGNGGTVAANGFASQPKLYTNGMISSVGTAQPNVGIIDVLDYGSSTKNKTFRILAGYEANGTGEIDVISGLFNSTNAITSISIAAEAGNFSTSSSFALYGIKEA